MNASMMEWAQRYALRAGWAVFPLRPRDKIPATSNGFKAAEKDPGLVGTLWEAAGFDCNVGLATGAVSGVFVLDVDASEPKGGGVAGPEALAQLEALHGPLPATRKVQTGGGGFHLYFRWPSGRTITNRARIHLPNGARTGLDCRGDGGYVVLPPSVHPSGRVYQWSPVREVAEAPEWLLDLLAPRRPAVVPSVARGEDVSSRYAEKCITNAIARVTGASEGMRHEELFKAAASLGGLVGGGVLTYGQAEAALVGAGLATGKGDREVRRTVRDGLVKGQETPYRPEPARQGHTRTTPAAYVVEEPPHVEEDGPPLPGDDDAPTGPAPEGFGGEEQEPQYRCTDVGNADRLIARFGKHLRWCAVMPHDGILAWDGYRWRSDDKRKAMEYARAVARDVIEDAEIATEAAEALRERGEADDAADEEKQAWKMADAKAKTLRAWARQSEMSNRMSAMVEVARSQMAVSQEELDADPWCLTTWGGTVDLRDNDLREARREDLGTRIAGAAAQEAQVGCPTWLAFLTRIMGNDAEMVEFLQRVCGYCLTGSTREQCLFVLYGSGANGKSTFLDTIRAVLGDYATHTRAETFMQDRKGGGIPNDIAALRGARLVTASEPDAGERFDEGLIKEMTGDAALTARFMRSEFFTFTPTFKVLLAANHKPVIRGTDNGVWRRMRLIPFEVTIPDAEKDRDLAGKLLAERDGILAWMIDGCRAWMRGGLQPPARVLVATQAYRAEMDVLGQFLDERCEKGDGATTTNADLFMAFTTWLKENGELPRSHRWLSRALAERGFKQAAGRANGRAWEGLSLRLATREDVATWPPRRQEWQ